MMHGHEKSDPAIVAVKPGPDAAVKGSFARENVAERTSKITKATINPTIATESLSVSDGASLIKNAVAIRANAASPMLVQSLGFTRKRIAAPERSRVLNRRAGTCYAELPRWSSNWGNP